MATSTTNTLGLQLPPSPPPPNGSVLALLAALSNHTSQNNNTHALALQARDDALSSSPEGYGDLCTNFVRVLACPSPELIPEVELKKLHDSDLDCFVKCCGWMMEDKDGASNNNNSTNNGSSQQQYELKKRQGMIMWNTLRQMAGLLLKNALVSPPLPRNTTLDALGRVLPGHARTRS